MLLSFVERPKFVAELLATISKFWFAFSFMYIMAPILFEKDTTFER